MTVRCWLWEGVKKAAGKNSANIKNWWPAAVFTLHPCMMPVIATERYEAGSNLWPYLNLKKCRSYTNAAHCILSFSHCGHFNGVWLAKSFLKHELKNMAQTAPEIIRSSGEYLGRGLAMIINLLYPQRIVIGSIYARNENIFRPHIARILFKEAIPLSLSVCKIVPALPGDAIGDYAAICVAVNGKRE